MAGRKAKAWPFSWFPDRKVPRQPTLFLIEWRNMQETRYMRAKSMVTLAVAVVMAGGVFVGAGSMAGCKRQERVSTVTQVPESEGPSTQDAIRENLEKSLAELYELPDLGPGVAFKTPDDEQW